MPTFKSLAQSDWGVILKGGVNVFDKTPFVTADVYGNLAFLRIGIEVVNASIVTKDSAEQLISNIAPTIGMAWGEKFRGYLMGSYGSWLVSRGNNLNLSGAWYFKIEGGCELQCGSVFFITLGSSYTLPIQSDISIFDGSYLIVNSGFGVHF